MWLHKASVPRDERISAGSPHSDKKLTVIERQEVQKQTMGLGVPSEMKFSAAISLLTSVTAAGNESPKVV